MSFVIVSLVTVDLINGVKYFFASPIYLEYGWRHHDGFKQVPLLEFYGSFWQVQLFLELSDG